MIKVFLYLGIILLVSGSANESAELCRAVPLDENRTHLEQLIDSCTEAFGRGSGDEITTYRLGYAFTKIGDYRSAYKWLKKSAQLGYPEAYRELALMVEKGEGVKKDPDLALMLYLVAIRPDNRIKRDAANFSKEVPLSLQSRVTEESLLKLVKKDSRHVYVHLGYTYLTGKYGVEKSKKKAFYWFMRAAEKKDPYAKIQLAKLCLAGIGTKEECEQTFDWNLELAHQDDPQAQYLLGLRYYRGSGVSKDEERALWWFVHSADQNNSDAEAMIKMINQQRDEQGMKKEESAGSFK